MSMSGRAGSSFPMWLCILVISVTTSEIEPRLLWLKEHCLVLLLGVWLRLEHVHGVGVDEVLVAEPDQGRLQGLDTQLIKLHRFNICSA